MLVGPGPPGSGWVSADPARRSTAGQPDDAARVIPIRGRVVDGLERPVAGVVVRVMVDPPGGMVRIRTIRDGVILNEPSTQAPLTTFTTDGDGRFAGSITSNGKVIRLDFAKEDYEEIIAPAVDAEDRTMRRLFGRSSIYGLTLARGDDRDRGLRDLLASAEWADSDKKLRRELFKYQADLQPAARRLVADRLVGEAAKKWLVDLADPADKELISANPPEEPLPDVRADDLVEAVKATARQVNWFSARPEPVISMEQITFTPNLDRASVECGINVAAMTGVFWRFVFHREGNRWVLRSMVQTGRA